MKQMYDTEVKRQTFGSPLIIRSSERQAVQDGIKSLLESLRSYDGNCKENVSLKLDFALSLVSCD